MSLPLTIQTLVNHNVLSPREVDLQALYINALEHLSLTAVDYLTIRDILQFIDKPGIEIHALMLCMFASLAEGSVCIRIDESNLNRRLHQFLNKDISVDCLVQKIMSSLKKQRFAAVIGQSIDNYKPLIRPTESLLYFHKYYAAEHRLGQTLKSIIGNDSEISPITDGNLNEVLTDVCDFGSMRLNGRDIHLNHDQALALIGVLLKRFIIISGGPGTGKTFLVITMLRLLARIGISIDRVKLAAPTGRAAQRLTESIHAADLRQNDGEQSLDKQASRDATTIHQMLGYRRSRNTFTHSQHNQLPADVVIIDEVSMIDIMLMTKLLQAIPETCRLIFLGDHNQLPSIDAGDVLANLMPKSSSSYSRKFQKMAESIRPGIRLPSIPLQDDNTLTDRVFFLSTNYRSEPTLFNIAAAINALSKKGLSADHLKSKTIAIIDDIPILNIRSLTRNCQFPEKGCWRLLPDQNAAKSTWGDAVQSWGHYHYLSSVDTAGRTYKDYSAMLRNWKFPSNNHNENISNSLAGLFRFINQGRVLTLIHEGVYGARGVNTRLINSLRPELDDEGSDVIFRGSMILITRNDKAKGLFNGDIGVILGDAGQGYCAVFSRSGSCISIPVNELPPYESAFAMTVHKSQGSEYDQVLLVLPENSIHRLLTREIIYTGLTRAKNLAVIYGSKDTLQTAMSTQIHRESGLDLWNIKDNQQHSEKEL